MFAFLFPVKAGWRKVRTLKGKIPGDNPGHKRDNSFMTASVTETIPSRLGGIRVKWRGKSSPVYLRMRRLWRKKF